jgi:hypothetical protein
LKPAKITADVRAFFTKYCSAYIRQDPAAICKHYADLVHISSDNGDRVTVHVATNEEMLKTIAHLLDGYRNIGFATAEALAVATDEMSSRLVQARVRWLLRDKPGNPIYEFDAMYTLARHTEIFRITAIALTEIPQYRRALEERSKPAL